MEQKTDWFKLDNAAKIYPATSSKKSPVQFRLGVTFNSPIKYNSLQKAWEKMIERCPYFQVYLQRGFFWYYLQRHQNIPPLELLEPVPESTFKPRQKFTHLIRIGVRDKTIALDFSHILTDGNGGIRFLLGLVHEYFRLEGFSIPKIQGIPHPEEDPEPEEFEDSHRKFFPGDLPYPETLSSAYHLPGKPFTQTKIKMISGKIPLDRIAKLSRENQVSITEYLTAVYMFSFKELYLQEASKRKVQNSLIRMQVPVNMRKFHLSQTMRNFSLYASPEIDLKLGDYSFDEILKRVHYTMKLQISQKELGRQVSRNVGGELNPIVRMIPLFAKDLYLGGLYSKLGEKCYSGVLSNLGVIAVPEILKDKIESFSFSIVPNNVMKKSCVMSSFGNVLNINFCSVVESSELERHFFTKLVEDGISVSVMEV